MDKNIITALVFAELRDISKKVDVRKINECIRLAQINDFKKLLGNFYYVVLKNYEVEAFKPLMEGANFNSEGLDRYHFGLNAVLADLVYARYIATINVNITAFGAGTKNHNDTTPVDVNTLKSISKQAQNDAYFKWEEVLCYLREQKETFSFVEREDGKEGSFNSLKVEKW